MRVFCTIGSIASGKSTFVDQHFAALPEQYVLIRPGRILREAVGLRAMAEDPNPNACHLTERFVQAIIREGLTMALKLNRDLVLDGAPRSRPQATFLFRTLSPLLSSGRIEAVESFVFIPSKTEIERRLGGRSEQEAQFDRIRLAESSVLATETQGQMRELFKRFKYLSHVR